MDTMDYPVEECLDRIRDKAKAPPAPFFSFTSIPIGTDEEYIAYLERRIKTLSVLLVERTLEKIQWEETAKKALYLAVRASEHAGVLLIQALKKITTEPYPAKVWMGVTRLSFKNADKGHIGVHGASSVGTFWSTSAELKVPWQEAVCILYDHGYMVQDTPEE